MVKNNIKSLKFFFFFGYSLLPQTTAFFFIPRIDFTIAIFFNSNGIVMILWYIWFFIEWFIYLCCFLLTVIYGWFWVFQNKKLLCGRPCRLFRPSCRIVSWLRVCLWSLWDFDWERCDHTRRDSVTACTYLESEALLRKGSYSIHFGT